MKTKNNQTMGYISSEEDRTIFQERENLIKTMTPFEFMIFDDFEKTFAGNMVNGFSYAKVLKSFITDYQSLLQNRSMDLYYWFLNGTGNVYDNAELINVPLSPVFYNTLFAKDLRYKSLIRADAKLAPFTYCLGFAQSSNYNYYPQNTCYTMKTLQDLCYGLKPAIPNVSSLSSNYIATVTSFTPVSQTYDYKLVTSVGSFTVSVSGSTQKHYTLPIPNCVEACVDFDVNPAYSTSSGVVNAQVVNFKIVMAVAVNGYSRVYTQVPSPNAIVSMLTNVMNIIAFFEGENTAMNVDGNYDGLASNNYEVLLQQQLDYLNNINDAVAQSLIDEKIESQNQKDDVIKKIADKKAEIQKYMEVKKQAIKQLNVLVAQRAELAGNV